MLKQLLTEVADFFPDDVMHVGSDETHSTGECTLASTAALERQIFALMQVPYLLPHVPHNSCSLSTIGNM